MWAHALPALALVSALLSSGSPTAASAPTRDADDAAAHPSRSKPVRLGGVRVRLRNGTRQVITVNHRSGHTARVSFWRKRKAGWRRIRTTRHGHIGYGGLVPGKKRKQGTGTTPKGSYELLKAFGNSRRPRGTKFRYHRVRKGDYWVQDTRSAHYNRRRHKSAGGFRWRLPADRYHGSERLADYPRQYRWSIVLKYNWRNPVRGRGSGIFLHVNGSGATAGCVSAPRRFIRKTLVRLRYRHRPVIAIGR